jgi:hypothetical protein
MKPFVSATLPVLFLFLLVSPALQAGTLSGIDPCALVAPDKVYAAFPALKTMKKQTIGANTTCNYLDKLGLPGLMVSVHQYDGISPHAMMENLGEGYTVKNVPGLGDEAAMALTRPNPELAIPGGLVAELYVKKGNTTLLIAPMRIEVRAAGEGLEKLQELAGEMLEQLPQ